MLEAGGLTSSLQAAILLVEPDSSKLTNTQAISIVPFYTTDFMSVVFQVRPTTRSLHIRALKRKRKQRAIHSRLKLKHHRHEVGGVEIKKRAGREGSPVPARL
jgi:hypothetical protein